MAGFNEGLDVVSKLLTTLVTAIALLVGLFGWIRGWWKGFKKWNKIANKANLFIDSMLPELLGHLCKTGRAPDNLLERWTTLLSTESFGRSSPITITEQGLKLIKETGKRTSVRSSWRHYYD